MFGRYIRKAFKNGATRCCGCGCPCQGFKGPDGKIYCDDCYFKVWGRHPY